MKQQLSFAALFFVAILFSGCVNFKGTDVSVWAGGKWILLVITGVPALYFYFRAYQKTKVNSKRQIPGGELQDNLGNMKIWQINLFKYAVALTIAFIAIYLGVTFTER